MAFSSLAFCQKSHVRLTLSTQWLFWLLPGFFLEEKAREKAVPIHIVLYNILYCNICYVELYVCRAVQCTVYCIIGGPLRGLLASAVYAGGAQPRERRPKVTVGTAKYRGPIVALRLNVRI